MTDMKTALVTQALGFAGPAAVEALVQSGFRVLAQDLAFGNEQVWQDFQGGRPDLVCLTEDEPEEIVARAVELGGPPAVIVSNDHCPAPAHLPQDAPLSALRENYERLVERPFRLIRSALPHLKTQASTNIIMITSNRMRLPLSGGAFPDAARSAANAMVRSLAIDCAPFGVSVNAIAPNFLYSEAYYPEAIFKASGRGMAYIKQNVPLGRLAEPEDIGELIAFLASARTRFLTGAVIDFSGGWPSGPARPS